MNTKLFLSFQPVPFAFFLCLVLITRSSFAQPLTIPPDLNPPQVWEWTYLSPNEKRVEQGRRLLEMAPEGLLISTGADRANFAAIMATNANHILVVDTDDNIRKYHETNWFLIAASKGDRKKYLHLRLRAAYHEWVTAAAELESHNAYLNGLRFENFEFWQNEVRDDPGFLSLDRDFSNVNRVGNGYSGGIAAAYSQMFEFVCRAEAPETCRAKLLSMTLREKIAFLIAYEIPYERWDEHAQYVDKVLAGEEVILNNHFVGDTNYLHSDFGFERLYRIVSSGSMSFALGNFFDTSRMQTILSAIQARKMKLSALDLSNIWDHNYPITAEQFAYLMTQLNPISTDDSMMVFTRVNASTAGYRAFHFKKLTSTPARTRALARVIKGMIFLEDRDLEFPESELDANDPGPNPSAILTKEIWQDVLMFVNPFHETFSFTSGFIDFDMGYLKMASSPPHSCESSLSPER